MAALHLLLAEGVTGNLWNPTIIGVLTVICAVGLFGSLKLPDIAGLADFKGALMHTAQWDHSVDLAGRNGRALS